MDDTATAGRTPVEDGFRMPPEWAPHEGCYMAWPCNVRVWGDCFVETRAAYAAVAAAISRFEPVTMLATPETADGARTALPSEITVLEAPLDSAWMRDNGPIFVASDSGEVALVDFEFNSYGGKFPPYDRDAAVPRFLAEHLGMRRYAAPMVLEGGAFNVDGEGTLLTTEQCLLNPNRNPGLSREEIEELLAAFLGIDKVLWLTSYAAHDLTDGHVDGQAAFVGPGVVVVARSEENDNVERLRTSTDARGRRLEVIELPKPEPEHWKGRRLAKSYINFYIANGGVVLPVYGDRSDKEAVAVLADVFTDRDVVPVDGRPISYGGGIVHCITQQHPKGAASRA
ncbi:MAG: agmatine/peptidylarginine deiminase [Dehalococcoidia bacterium]